MDGKYNLIHAIEDATVHLGTVPTIINLLIDQYHLDERKTTPEDLMLFQSAKHDLLKLLYLASNIVQDADKAIDDALEEALKNMREEG